MQIVPFLPHYQLVYINFDFSSFSLISYTAICTKLRGNLMQFGNSFDANCMDFQREYRALFECNFITT